MHEIAFNKNTVRSCRLKARRQAGIIAVIPVELTQHIANTMQRVGLCDLNPTRKHLGKMIGFILQNWADERNNCLEQQQARPVLETSQSAVANYGFANDYSSH